MQTALKCRQIILGLGQKQATFRQNLKSFENCDYHLFKEAVRLLQTLPHPNKTLLPIIYLKKTNKNAVFKNAQFKKKNTYLIIGNNPFVLY
jgi:hypothetical protein